MNGVIGDILPLALGIAISPIPIIAATLMLLSPRATSTSGGFLVGWIVGIVVATALFTAIAGGLTSSGASPSWTAWAKIGLGVLLLTHGIGMWRARGANRTAPKWMAALDQFTVVKALGLGFALAAVNPKNLLMAAAAGLSIGSAGLAVGGEVVAVAVFTLLAASTVAIPVVAYLFAHDKMRGPLDRLRTWLQDNNAAVMSVLILVIGVVLIGKGVAGL